MAGYKLLKRKGGGVDEISDDFSDFSLSSPATKIRRLDSASLLPPIVEEDDQPPSFTNQERALVLFKPLHHHSPASSYSLTVDSDLLSQIKNQQLPWWSREEERDDKSNNHRLAIVPWVPQSSSFSTLDEDNTNAEMMEADDDIGEEGEGVMDIEEEQQDTAVGNAPSTSITNFPTAINLPEGFQQQQQQQHCFLPHLPQSNSTPITWTR